MPGIVLYFEENDTDVYSGRAIDLDAWNYAIKTVGDIDTMIVVNKTDQKLLTPDAMLDFRVVSELPPLEGRLVHVVCPWDNCAEKIPLWDFDHAVDWYLFGPGTGWTDKIPNAKGVYVPQDGIAACHSVHIATAVMLHRYGVTQWQ